MELRFVPKTVNYLCRILQEARAQEETLELIVPDSFPDVERVLCGNAVAVVRNKECCEGCVIVSGAIRANALYMAEGELLPRCIEAYLPFTAKLENIKLHEDSKVLFCVNVRSVDVRMLNSRKLVVRVNLNWCLTVYGECQQEIQTLEEPPADLQTHLTEYPMLLPAETAERSFQMTEELELPASRPLVGQVYYFSPRAEITERRLVGNKAVLKGLLHLHMLYGTTDNKLSVYDTELPFSQYCELNSVYEEEELQMWITLTGCELDRTLQQDREGLLATLHLLVQCVVMKREKVGFIEDAYCVSGEFVPQWSEISLTNCLDRQQITRTMRESKSADVQEIADAWVYPSPGQVTQMDGSAEIVVPSVVTVLYQDAAGVPQAMSFRSELKERIQLAETARCFALAEVAGDIIAIPASGGVELRYPVAVETESYADGVYKSLTGGEISDTEADAERPAVIVRRTRSGESLWEIAKHSRTTVEKIQRANCLETEETEAGVLLIPM